MAKVVERGERQEQKTNANGSYILKDRRAVVAYYSGVVNPNVNTNTQANTLINVTDTRPSQGQMWPRGSKHGGGA